MAVLTDGCRGVNTVRDALRKRIIRLARILQGTADLVLDLAILSFACLFLLQFFHSPKLNHLSLVADLKRAGNPVIAELASWIQADWPVRTGFSFVPVGLVFFTWLVKIVIDGIFLKAHRTVERLGRKQRLSSLRTGSGWTGGGISPAESERARVELLQRYRQIEQVLKQTERKRCTFLSVDVVGSTQIKRGEKEINVAATFQAYDEVVRKILAQYGAWKQTWTPDGVLACFLQTELAVAAAQRLLESLEKFNQIENRLRAPFQVRCGLNEGELAIYEDSRLKMVADHAIDLAGHLQKQCPPDTLRVSGEVYARLANTSGFQPTGGETEALAVWEWRPPLDLNATGRLGKGSKGNLAPPSPEP